MNKSLVVEILSSWEKFFSYDDGHHGINLIMVFFSLCICLIFRKFKNKCYISLSYIFFIYWYAILLRNFKGNKQGIFWFGQLVNLNFDKTITSVFISTSNSIWFDLTLKIVDTSKLLFMFYSSDQNLTSKEWIIFKIYKTWSKPVL